LQCRIFRPNSDRIIRPEKTGLSGPDSFSFQQSCITFDSVICFQLCYIVLKIQKEKNRSKVVKKRRESKEKEQKKKREERAKSWY